MPDKRSLSPSRLFFCPRCRWPFPRIEVCPACNLLANTEAISYVEKLLETILSAESYRAEMAVGVLTRWQHEQRVIVPLSLLLERRSDPPAQVLGARGLGWLHAESAVPVLARLLLDESRPYVARVAAAEALGRIGGEEARQALQQTTQSSRPSVTTAALRALAQFCEAKQEIPS